MFKLLTIQDTFLASEKSLIWYILEEAYGILCSFALSQLAFSHKLIWQPICELSENLESIFFGPALSAHLPSHHSCHCFSNWSLTFTRFFWPPFWTPRCVPSFWTPRYVPIWPARDLSWTPADFELFPNWPWQALPSHWAAIELPIPRYWELQHCKPTMPDISIVFPSWHDNTACPIDVITTFSFSSLGLNSHIYIRKYFQGRSLMMGRRCFDMSVTNIHSIFQWC